MVCKPYKDSRASIITKDILKEDGYDSKLKANGKTPMVLVYSAKCLPFNRQSTVNST